MTLPYTLLDPTGNLTLLVESDVPPEQQPDAAARLMCLEPTAEQVGFVSLKEEPTLRMAGGEFCGNASMSTAVLWAERRGLREAEIAVHVSGTPEPVPVQAKRLPDGGWRCTVRMPKPLSVARMQLPDGQERPVVRFPGITHILFEEEMERADAETLAPVWCWALDAEALGLMFLDREREKLSPLVYVPGAGTLFWESSCASGTTAVGACLALERGSGQLALRQPGGTLQIAAEPDGNLLLTGTVRTVRRGELT